MPTNINDQHLSMIQGVVDRLAGNSFALKGWSVTLVSALLALAVSEGHVWIAWIALLPAVTFWGLDGYFLAQERLFRRLYAAVIDPEQSVPSFSMVTDRLMAAEWIEATLSLTLILFHGTILATLVGVLSWSLSQ